MDLSPSSPPPPCFLPTWCKHFLPGSSGPTNAHGPGRQHSSAGAREPRPAPQAQDQGTFSKKRPLQRRSSGGPSPGMLAAPEPREPLRRVAVSGGTHGNEMSGVYLARLWLRAPGELQRPSFSALPVLANPEAAAVCRRYVGQDLNRSFTHSFLGSRATPGEPYEVTRARELNSLLGPKASSQAFDFLLDLHNTTANMGACLITREACSIFTKHLCHHLQLQNPELSCKVFLHGQIDSESFSLDSVTKNALTLELGPQPQGVLRADLFSRMRALVASALDFIELFNQGTAFPAFEMEAYRYLGKVDFPRTADGLLAGIVHPQLQDRDFEPLQPGAPIFQMFDGEDVLYGGDSTVYPVFINEAAYYEKHVAFIQSEKLALRVPALAPLTPADPRVPALAPLTPADPRVP